MANLKNITDLPVAETAEGLNLIVNDNGSAKQIAASAVGAQADFAVTDETSPAFIKNKPEIAQADWAETDEFSSAFIKNKPVEKWDLDFTCDITWNDETSESNPPMFTIHTGTFENVKNKILNGVPKIKIRINMQASTGIDGYITQTSECDAMYIPEGILGDNPELIGMSVYGIFDDTFLNIVLLPDNTIQFN